MQSTVTTVEEMINYGYSLAKEGKTHIMINGNLGAGKTHCVKGFVKGCGGNPDMVQSPTYTYSNIYQTPKGSVCHIDMYRIEKEQELQNKGLIESMDNADFVLIERPKWEKIYADHTRVTLSITQSGENKRIITLS